MFRRMSRGNDDTLYALTDGVVKFGRLGRDRRQVSVVSREEYKQIIAK